jgi:hypothetical protein
MKYSMGIAMGKIWAMYHALVMSKFVDVCIPFCHYEIIDGAWMVH